MRQVNETGRHGVTFARPGTWFWLPPDVLNCEKHTQPGRHSGWVLQMGVYTSNPDRPSCQNHVPARSFRM